MGLGHNEVTASAGVGGTSTPPPPPRTQDIARACLPPAQAQLTCALDLRTVWDVQLDTWGVFSKLKHMIHKSIFPSLSKEAPLIVPSTAGGWEQWPGSSPCLTGCRQGPGARGAPGAQSLSQSAEPPSQAVGECEPRRQRRLPATGAPSSPTVRPTRKDPRLLFRIPQFSALPTHVQPHTVCE